MDKELVAKKLAEISAHTTELAAAKAAYLEVANGLPAEAREASVKVRELQKKLSAAITEGCSPCPCGAGAPHGMAQPLSRPGKAKTARVARFEYEIGCLACALSVRGGLLPHHAVDTWNVAAEERAEELAAAKAAAESASESAS